MKWRIMVVLSFDDEKRARGLWTAIQAIKAHGLKQLDDGGNLHRCFHDETPGRPCEVVEEIEPPSP